MTNEDTGLDANPPFRHPIGTVLLGRHSGARVRVVGYIEEDDNYIIVAVDEDNRRQPGADTEALSFYGAHHMFIVIPDGRPLR